MENKIKPAQCYVAFINYSFEDVPSTVICYTVSIVDERYESHILCRYISIQFVIIIQLAHGSTFYQSLTDGLRMLRLSVHYFL